MNLRHGKMTCDGMSSSTMHFNGLDFLRALCVFLVVWIHGCDTSSTALQLSKFCCIAVPSFILMSFFLLQLSVLNNPQRAMFSTLAKRLGRLILPYLFWSVVYITVRQYKHFLQGECLEYAWIRVLGMGKAAYHLYFIAAMVYWTILFFPLFYWGRMKNALSAMALLAFGGVLLWGGGWVRSHMEIKPALIWTQMLVLSGYVPLGMALSRWWFLYKTKFIETEVVRLLGWLLGVVALGWIILEIPVGSVLVPSLGIFAFGLLVSPKRVSAAIQRISKLSYGIFLVHGLFVEGLQTLVRGLGWPIERFVITLFIILLSFGCSYLLCSLIYRVSKLRWSVT